MGRRELFLFFSSVLLVLLASAQLCSCEDAPAAPSVAKGWSDWAQDKIGSYRKKEEKPIAGAPAGSWSSWATDKFSSVTGRTPKDVEKATEAGKEKVKAEGQAASEKAKEATEKAKEAGSEGADKLEL